MSTPRTTEPYPRQGSQVRCYLSVLALAALTACGGGGGDATVATEAPQAIVPTGTETAPQAVPIEAWSMTSQAFRFQMDQSFNGAQTIADLTGGDLAAGWNLKSPGAALRPGMKVAFFGQASGCQTALIDGPLSFGTDADLSAAVQKTGVAASATSPDWRWTPAGVAGSCDTANESRTGPSWVYLNPSSAGGSVALYTPSGPQADGSAPFLGVLGAQGADGQGSNSNIGGTFVGFRMPWWASDAVRPWSEPTAEARVVSTQNLGSYQVASADAPTTQVKQQVIVSVINTACQSARDTVIGPCQIQYLFNTATMRSGVTDWEAYAPSTQGRIWFDGVQGSTPIVSGLVPTAGKTVADPDSGLALYSSQGGATQHATFSLQNFDLRITFPQLVNAVRIIAARRLGGTLATLTDEQVASVWGAAWNNPAQWSFVAASVGQEVYNPASATQVASIGGGFASLYVGPK